MKEIKRGFCRVLIRAIADLKAIIGRGSTAIGVLRTKLLAQTAMTAAPELLTQPVMAAARPNEMAMPPTLDHPWHLHARRMSAHSLGSSESYRPTAQKRQPCVDFCPPPIPLLLSCPFPCSASGRYHPDHSGSTPSEQLSWSGRRVRGGSFEGIKLISTPPPKKPIFTVFAAFSCQNLFKMQANKKMSMCTCSRRGHSCKQIIYI